MAPAALSLITFTEPRERARAFGVFGALSGGGAAIGLIVGGVLTEYSSGTRRCARPPTPDSATPGAGFSSRCRNGPSPADRYPPTSTSTYSPTAARGLLVTDDDATRVVDAVLLPALGHGRRAGGSPTS